MTLTPLTQQNKLVAPASQADLLNGSTTPTTKGNKKNGRQIVGFLDAQKMQH